MNPPPPPPNTDQSNPSNHHHHHHRSSKSNGHHHHHHHHTNGNPRARPKPSVPQLSVSTNHLAANRTQQTQQPSTSTTNGSGNTVSPIQLQTLAHSPSVSDFRIRSRSSNSTSAPNGAAGNTTSKSSSRTKTPIIIATGLTTPQQQQQQQPTNNTNNNSLKATLQNIELKMRIIASPNIRIADLFKCFLKNVPKSTETVEVS